MDIGITNGASVTDFVRTFHQKAFRLEEHVDRFFKGAKNAYLTIPHTREEVCEISRKLFELNAEVYPECELGMCYYVTPGVNYVYAGSAAKAGPLTPTYCQHVFPLPLTAWKKFYTDGLNMVTAPIPHLPAQCVSPKGKNRNRLHMWTGDHIVAALDPTATAIYLDANGNITETGGSNFVIYKDGKVISPRARNILWGVSLQVVKELVTKMGIPFVEDDIMIYDVVNADEAWVTTTPYCLAPVARFNGQVIGDGEHYPMFRKVLAAWSELVGKDLWEELTLSEPIRYR
jgi:branched-subunit amino acid aminotransferase/4-amino-4-deoxychorismate lyase